MSRRKTEPGRNLHYKGLSNQQTGGWGRGGSGGAGGELNLWLRHRERERESNGV